MAMRNAKGAPAVGLRARLRKMNFAPCEKFRKPCEIRKIKFHNPVRNFATLCEIFATLCEIFATLCEISQPYAKQSTEEPSQKQFSHTMRNFASLAKSSYVILRFFFTDSVRFLSSDILCKYPIFSL